MTAVSRARGAPPPPPASSSRGSSSALAALRRDKRAAKTKKVRTAPPQAAAADQKRDSRLRELLVNALSQFPYRISPSIKRRLLTAVDLLEDRPADVTPFLGSSDALDTQLIQDQPLLRERTVELLFQLLTVLAICALAFAVGITIGSIVCRTTLFSGSAIVALDVEPPAVEYTKEFSPERAQVTLLLPLADTWEKKPNVTAILRGRFNLSLPEYSLGSYVEGLSAVLTLTYLPATHIGRTPAVCFPNLQPPEPQYQRPSSQEKKSRAAAAAAAAQATDGSGGSTGGTAAPGATPRRMAAAAALALPEELAAVAAAGTPAEATLKRSAGTTAAGGTAAGGTAAGGTAAAETSVGGTSVGGTPVGGTAVGGTAAGGTAVGGAAVGRTAVGAAEGTAGSCGGGWVEGKRAPEGSSGVNGERAKFPTSRGGRRFFQKEEEADERFPRAGALSRRLAVPPDDGAFVPGSAHYSPWSGLSSSASSPPSLSSLSLSPGQRRWRARSSEFLHRYAATAAERLRRSRVERRRQRGDLRQQSGEVDEAAMILTAAAAGGAAGGRIHEMINATNYALVRRAIEGLSLLSRAGVSTHVPLHAAVYDPISGNFEEGSLMLLRHSAAAGFPLELLGQAAAQSGEIQPTLLFRSILPFVVGLSHGFNEVHVTASINVSLVAENEQLLRALTEDCALKRVFLSLEVTVQAVRTMFFKQTHGKRLLEPFHVLCSVSNVTEEKAWPPPPPSSFVRDVAELAAEYTSLSLGFSNAV